MSNDKVEKRYVGDSHYYYINGEHYPGVTTILDSGLPKAPQLIDWIAKTGPIEAERKLKRAARRGTLIHKALERLLNGQTVDLEREFPKARDKKVLLAFVNWAKEANLSIKATEMVVYSHEHQFAGTLDLWCLINGEDWVIDFKTSSGIYKSHKLQITAYQQALYEMTGVRAQRGIMHLNYRAVTKIVNIYDRHFINRNPVTFDDFLTVIKMYKMLHGGKYPHPPTPPTYPRTLSLVSGGP